MRMMVQDRAMYGWKLKGKRCDIGNPEGFVRTNLEFALRHKDLTDSLRQYLKQLVKTL